MVVVIVQVSDVGVGSGVDDVDLDGGRRSHEEVTSSLPPVTSPTCGSVVTPLGVRRVGKRRRGCDGGWGAVPLLGSLVE
jgi:hypothetical protein